MGDVGEARAEDEAVHRLAARGQGVRKMQEHSRVGTHGTRNIADQDEGRRPRPSLPGRELDELSVVAQHGPNRTSQVEPTSIRACTEPSRRHLAEQQMRIAQHALRVTLLFEAHLFEILLPKHFAG